MRRKKVDRLGQARNQYRAWIDRREDAIAVLVKSAERIPALGRQIARLQKAAQQRLAAVEQPQPPLFDAPLPLFEPPAATAGEGDALAELLAAPPSPPALPVEPRRRRRKTPVAA
jgi:hypothetical protein